MWTQDARPTLHGQWLAWQITFDYAIDPAERVELVRKLTLNSLFKPNVIIRGKKEAMKEAEKIKWVWYYGRMCQSLIKVTLQLRFVKKTNQPAKWKERSIFLGKNKEVLNAEL